MFARTNDSNGVMNLAVLSWMQLMRQCDEQTIVAGKLKEELRKEKVRDETHTHTFIHLTKINLCTQIHTCTYTYTHKCTQC